MLRIGFDVVYYTANSGIGGDKNGEMVLLYFYIDNVGH